MLPSDRPNVSLDVERRQHLLVQDEVADVRARAPRSCRCTVSPKASALRRPTCRAVGQLVRRVLHEARHDVLARRRHGRVDQRRDDHVDVRPAREVPVLGVVVGLLHVVQPTARTRSRRAGARRRPGRHVKSGSPSSARFTLPEEPRNLNRATSSAERPRASAPGSTQLEERLPGVEARQHDVGVDLLAAVEDDAGRPVAVDDRCAPPAPRSGSRRRASARRSAMAFDDAAGAAPRDAPRAERAVDLAHVVVQQHVRRPRRAHALERPDDARTPTSSPSAGRSRTTARRKSAALIVISWTNTACWRSGSSRNAFARPTSGSHSRGSTRPGSGGDDRQDRLDEARHVDHQLAVLLVRLGVGGATSGGARASSGRGRSRATGSRRRAA